MAKTIQYIPNELNYIRNFNSPEFEHKFIKDISEINVSSLGYPVFTTDKFLITIINGIAYKYSLNMGNSKQFEYSTIFADIIKEDGKSVFINYTSLGKAGAKLSYVDSTTNKTTSNSVKENTKFGKVVYSKDSKFKASEDIDTSILAQNLELSLGEFGEPLIAIGGPDCSTCYYKNSYNEVHALNFRYEFLEKQFKEIMNLVRGKIPHNISKRYLKNHIQGLKAASEIAVYGQSIDLESKSAAQQEARAKELINYLNKLEKELKHSTDYNSLNLWR